MLRSLSSLLHDQETVQHRVELFHYGEGVFSHRVGDQEISPEWSALCTADGSRASQVIIIIIIIIVYIALLS